MVELIQVRPLSPIQDWRQSNTDRQRAHGGLSWGVGGWGVWWGAGGVVPRGSGVGYNIDHESGQRLFAEPTLMRAAQCLWHVTRDD